MSTTADHADLVPRVSTIGTMFARSENPRFMWHLSLQHQTTHPTQRSIFHPTLSTPNSDEYVSVQTGPPEGAGLQRPLLVSNGRRSVSDRPTTTQLDENGRSAAVFAPVGA